MPRPQISVPGTGCARARPWPGRRPALGWHASWPASRRLVRSDAIRVQTHGLSSAILLWCRTHWDGARQVARVAKGSGL